MSRMQRWPESEADLAAVVVAHLLAEGYEVYQEVQVFRQGDVADIVAVRERQAWVIECKRSLGFAVIEQALSWRHMAHRTSVAVTYPQRDVRGKSIARDCCEWKKLGLLYVNSGGVREELEAPLHGPMSGSVLLNALCEEQKTCVAAGSATGGHWTPFRGTCIGIRDYVQEHPGASISELLMTVPHHYNCDASARSALLGWAQRGKIPGVRVEQEGRFWRFWPSLTVDEELQQ